MKKLVMLPMPAPTSRQLVRCSRNTQRGEMFEPALVKSPGVPGWNSSKGFVPDKAQFQKFRDQRLDEPSDNSLWGQMLWTDYARWRIRKEIADPGAAFAPAGG